MDDNSFVTAYEGDKSMLSAIGDQSFQRRDTNLENDGNRVN